MERTSIASRIARKRLVCLIAATAGIAMAVVGCGTIPDAQVTYYKAKSKVSFKVTRSILCDSKGYPMVANTATPNVAHSADTTTPQQFKLASLRGILADSDIKFELFEDGRLKGVNASVNGQGDAAIKALTTLASTLAAFEASPPPASRYREDCDFIKEVGGGKPISLTYEGEVDLSKTAPQPIGPDAASKPYADRLKGALEGLCVAVGDKVVQIPPVQYIAAQGDLLILARQPALVRMTVGTTGPGGLCTKSLWDGSLLIAHMGADYVLPVPKAALFGKLTFGAGFTEAGALTSIQYASTSGAAGALGATNSLASLGGVEETIATKAAAIKAEADLIAQQQRLIQCVADPKSCK
jgi:hypothetical protein